MPFDTRLPHSAFCYFHREGDLPCIRIAHPRFSASILLQGAQLVRFATIDRGNWLWMSDREPFTPGQAVRGGIPICWPWFGDPARNPEAVRRTISTEQAHGFARTCLWDLDSLHETARGVELTLALNTRAIEAGARQRAGWDGDARVEVRFQFTGSALAVSLATLNQGTADLHLSQALHTYLPTADIRRTRILGLNDRPYVDAMDGWRRRVQQGPVRFRGETDRIYDTAGPLQLATPAGVWQLRQTGSQSAVVWNPWQDKARRLSHFAPEAWRRMFCVETANALDDAVRIGPGQRHVLGMELRPL